MPELVIVGGPIAGRRIALPASGLVLGRGEEAQLRLDAEGVSRKHARIVPDGHGQIHVLDLGSTNGTFVNGRRVDVASVKEGDLVTIGSVVVRVGWSREDDSCPTEPLPDDLAPG